MNDLKTGGVVTRESFLKVLQTEERTCSTGFRYHLRNFYL